MPFSIIQQNLTTMRTDVIVNTTNEYYSGGGGVDQAIHKAAGPELFEACGYLGRLHQGQVKATEAYKIPVKYIFHTRGPYWKGGSNRESELLAYCYRHSIALAREKGCKSIAFPLISSQTNGFPKSTALTVAVNAILASMRDRDDIAVYLVLYTDRIKQLSESLFPEIQHIIEQDYRPGGEFFESPALGEIDDGGDSRISRKLQLSIMFDDASETGPAQKKSKTADDDIDHLIDALLTHPTQKNLDKIPIDESFAQLLARIITERELKHAQVRDELGMSGVGFWKLLKGKSNPSKLTVFGLAVALRLSIEETTDMLLKAGYAINPSSLQDVIIAGLIRKKMYDRYAMDSLLYALDLQLLPGAIID